MQTFQTQNMQVGATDIAFERIGKLLEPFLQFIM